MGTVNQEQVLSHVTGHVEYLLENSPIYGHFFRDSRIKHAEKGRVVIQIPLQPFHLNSKKSLHGSVSATIVDFMGGVAISSYDLRDNTGVSTNISIEYCGGAKDGDTLEVEGIADKVGGSLAFTTVNIRKTDGTLVALGRHTKFVKTR